jgi:hypothetical protein
VTDFGFAFSQQPKKKPSKLEAGQLYIDAGRVCATALGSQTQQQQQQQL